MPLPETTALILKRIASKLRLERDASMRMALITESIRVLGQGYHPEVAYQASAIAELAMELWAEEKLNAPGFDGPTTPDKDLTR